MNLRIDAHAVHTSRWGVAIFACACSCVTADGSPADGERVETFLPCAVSRSALITTQSLLDEMSDLDRLSDLSQLRFRALLSSSYDRASVGPDRPGWFANRDAGHYLRVEGNDRVMLDVRGPGAITRIFAANPVGRVSIYLDDATDPVIDADLASLLRGEVAPFARPYTSLHDNVGVLLNYPIPYARSARVVLRDPPPWLWYQIDHRSYPEGTPVETFSLPASATVTCAARTIAALDGAFRHAPSGEALPLQLHTVTSPSRLLRAPEGGAVIRRLTLDVDPREDWRETSLEIDFDGERTVSAPLPDLFVWEPRGIETRSLPVEATRGGSLTIRFPMPFRDNAVLRLVDPQGRARSLRGEVEVDRRPFTDDSLYFHASWTGAHDFDGRVASEWRLASIRGAGAYVGTALHIANPDPQWWGEGDHRVWVDGESFPGIFGTGTEDYFGFAFCSSERFSGAYTGQVRANRTNVAGYTTLYRFHVGEPIPFSRSLDFDLEVIHWGKGWRTIPLGYDATYFYYSRPGATEVRDPATPSLRRPALPAEIVEEDGDAHTRC